MEELMTLGHLEEHANDLKAVIPGPDESPPAFQCANDPEIDTDWPQMPNVRRL